MLKSKTQLNPPVNRKIVVSMAKRGSREAVEFDRKFWADAGQSRLQRSVCSLYKRVGKHELILSKKAIDRPQDIIDITNLERDN